MKSTFPFVLWTISASHLAINSRASSVTKWHKHVEEFEPILELPFYDRETRITALQSAESRASKKQIHNFNAKPLRLTYFEERSFVQFYDNDTKVSGIYGDLWTLLSEMLNFTLVTERSEENSVGKTYANGSYSGILEKARLNRTDIIPKIEGVLERTNAVSLTAGFWLNHYRIFAHAQWKHDKGWIFRQFSVKTWCCVLIFIVILSVGGLAMQRILMMYRGFTLRTTLLDHLFGTLATVCNQGPAIDNESTGLKILTITVSTFSWLILVGYNARLMYGLSYEVFAAPYDDLKSLYERTSLQLVIKNGSFAHLSFTDPPSGTLLDRINRANRLKPVSSLRELEETLCLKPKTYALLDDDDHVRVLPKRTCDLLPVGSDSFNVPMTSGISKSVKDKESIDIGIMKLREFGIASAIRGRWFPLNLRKPVVREVDSLAMGLNQFSLVLTILAMGIVASIIICVAENISFALRERKINRRLPQRLSGIGQQPEIHGMPIRTTSESNGKLYFTELYIHRRPQLRISLQPLMRDY